MTLEELQEEIISGTSPNFEQLRRNVRENVQWAWDHWEERYLDDHYEGEKPDRVPDSFFDEWVSNEPFDSELGAINNPD